MNWAMYTEHVPHQGNVLSIMKTIWITIRVERQNTQTTIQNNCRKTVVSNLQVDIAVRNYRWEGSLQTKAIKESIRNLNLS